MDTLLTIDNDNGSIMSYIGQGNNVDVVGDDYSDNMSLYAYSIAAASNLQGSINNEDNSQRNNGRYHHSNHWSSSRISNSSYSTIPTSVVFQQEEQNPPPPPPGREDDDDEMFGLDDSLKEEEKEMEVPMEKEAIRCQQQEEERLDSSYIMSTMRKQQQRLHEYHGETEDETSADSGSEISSIGGRSGSIVHPRESNASSLVPAGGKSMTKNKRRRRFWKSIRKSFKGTTTIYRRMSEKLKRPTPSQILQLEKEMGLASAEASYRSERRASF